MTDPKDQGLEEPKDDTPDPVPDDDPVPVHPDQMPLEGGDEGEDKGDA